MKHVDCLEETERCVFNRADWGNLGNKYLKTSENRAVRSLSDLEVERQISDRILFMVFLGFPDPIPDSRTI